MKNKVSLGARKALLGWMLLFTGFLFYLGYVLTKNGWKDYNQYDNFKYGTILIDSLELRSRDIGGYIVAYGLLDNHKKSKIILEDTPRNFDHNKFWSNNKPIKVRYLEGESEVYEDTGESKKDYLKKTLIAHIIFQLPLLIVLFFYLKVSYKLKKEK